MEKMKKYWELVSDYTGKSINRAIHFHPHITNIEWAIQHKVDGSNFQIAVEESGELRFGSRSQWLDSYGSFQGVNLQYFMNEHKNLIEKLIKYSTNNQIDIAVYGELFGKNIQKRINYGNYARFQCFDVVFNHSVYLSVLDFNLFLKAIDCFDYAVETFAVVNSLQDALDFDTRRSSIDIVGDDIIEGVVIKPFREVIIVDGDPFYIKKRNKEFLEKSKVNKTTASIEKSEAIKELKEILLSYLNDNRILNCFSKYEPIKERSELGKYIKIIMEDMKKDFLKENSIAHIEDGKELKWLFNIGQDIVQHLEKYL